MIDDVDETEATGGDNTQQVAATSPQQPQQVVGASVPYGYEVWGDGVYLRGKDAMPSPTPPSYKEPISVFLLENRRRITHRPLWVSGLGRTQDTQEPLAQLTFGNVAGALETIWIDRADMADTRRLTTLSARGLPVDSVNARDVVMYLRACEGDNGTRLPMLHVGHRSGPYVTDAGMGWLVGTRWIGPGHLEADPRGQARFTGALVAKGDAQAWMDKWRALHARSWITRWGMAATFAAPLLRLVGSRTFILHHWGDSSSGKTALASFAMSAWGDPSRLFSSLNRTAISLTEVFKHVTDLPVLFDEKQVSTVTSEEIIYAVCMGAGRERASREGGLRQDRTTWITMARTTGEVPLVGPHDVGGQNNRVLQVHSIAFPQKREAEALYGFMGENYGHAGPAFMEHLAAAVNAGAGSRLKRIHEEIRAAITAQVGEGNHAGYAACVGLAQVLSDVWLLGEDAALAKARAIDDSVRAVLETAPAQVGTYAERALGRLRDHFIANPMAYVDDTTTEGRERSKYVLRMTGVECSHGVVFVPHEADEILRASGYDPARVWRDFGNRGWLIRSGASLMTTINLRGAKSPDHPVYLVKREHFFGNESRPTLRVVNGGGQAAVEDDE